MAKAVKKPTTRTASPKSVRSYGWIVVLLLLLQLSVFVAISYGVGTVFHESVMRCDPASKLVDCFVPTLVIELKGKK